RLPASLQAIRRFAQLPRAGAGAQPVALHADALRGPYPAPDRAGARAVRVGPGAVPYAEGLAASLSAGDARRAHRAPGHAAPEARGAGFADRSGSRSALLRRALRAARAFRRARGRDDGDKRLEP